MSDNHNLFFSLIVENEDDFVGSLAYVLYKNNKVEFIKQYKESHGGIEPDYNTMKVWQEGECISSKIKNYKELAQWKANEFINNLIIDKEGKLTKLQSDLNEREKKIKERERNLKKRETYCHIKNKGHFWVGVLESLIASILFIILCFVLLVSVKDRADIIGWITDILS